MRVTFLGTGTSRGVPVIGCECRVCRSDNARNRRLRCSALIEADVTVLIDTSSDFRQQMLAQDVKHLDAVVYTHHHADHVLGMDDLFPLTARSSRALPVYADSQTMGELKVTFRHMFNNSGYGGVARIQPNEITGAFSIGSLKFEPIRLFHGKMPILGFRVGRFAYLTDVSHIPEESIARLNDLDYLVLDGLRYRPHPTHFSIDQALEAAGRIGAKQTLLIHMSHDVDHDEGNAALPEGVELAYDGLQIQLT